MTPPSEDHGPDEVAQVAKVMTALTNIPPFGGDVWQRTKAFFEEHSALLLTAFAEDLLARYTASRINDMSARSANELESWMVQSFLSEKLALIRRSRKLGIETAFLEQGGRLLADWTGDFLNLSSAHERANNWADTRDLIYNSAFLSDAAQPFLRTCPMATPRSADAFNLGDLFSRIRTIGFDKAFEDLLEFGADVPTSLRSPFRNARNARDRYRASGDRLALNAAIEYWEGILDSLDLEQASAHTQRLILLEAGDTYENRYQERNALEDLDRAITLWQRAGDLGSIETMGIKWPQLQKHIGDSYLRGAKTAMDALSAERIDLAIQHYQQAYEVAEDRTSGVMPAPIASLGPDLFTEHLELRRQRALFLNDTASAYLLRFARTEEIADLDNSIDFYRRAVQINDTEERRAPFLRTDLADALALRYLRSVGPGPQNPEDEDFKAACSGYREAVGLCNAADAIFELNAATNYGSFLYDTGWAADAKKVLQKAHIRLEELQLAEKSRRSRNQHGSFAERICPILVACCLADGEVHAAFRYASFNKSQAMKARLNSDLGPPILELRDNPEFLEGLATLGSLRRELDILQLQLNSHEPASERFQLRLHLLVLRQRERYLWDDLVSRYGDLEPAGDILGLDFGDATFLAHQAGATLVEYYQHSEGWCAFVATSDTLESVALPLLSQDLLARANSTIVRATERVELAEFDPRLLEEWYDAAVAPLAGRLDPTGANIVAPHGEMHAFPYNAAIDPSTGRYVVDDYIVSFVPSFRVLADILRRDGTSPPPRDKLTVLSVAYPGLIGSEDYLANAVPEADSIRTGFPNAQTLSLLGEEASIGAVLDALSNAHLAHIACHGSFDPKFPAQSGLRLADGWLSARRIESEADLRANFVLTLGGCVTARAEVGSRGEMSGLTQSALVAGARTVVSSLWNVNDQSARELFSSFYESLANGLSPGAAMQQAARRLRAYPHWNHPYFWAPFVVSGLGNTVVSGSNWE